ncbi:MAG: 4Fe-4S ferredoxin [Eubacteriaceae bacterium]|nr:4Fe-4S ferredoxin [Eubacteriaceae bacterium]
MKITKEKKVIKNIQSWSYVIILGFFILSFLDRRFGIFGLVCMGHPVYLALKGHGKAHCSKVCPRGSFFGNVLDKISMNNTLPKSWRTKKVKNGILVLMIFAFSWLSIRSGGGFVEIATVIFRMMFISFLIGTLLGIIFKPRSWCQVCPMGHGAYLIDKKMK